MILFEAEHVYVIKSTLSNIYKHIKSHIMRFIHVVSVPHVLSMSYYVYLQEVPQITLAYLRY